MRAFFSKLLCLLAIITMIDGHIIALQGFAWATMLHDRIPEQGVSEAIATTFDGESPCEHCLTTQKLIENKQESEHTRTVQFQLSDLKAPNSSTQKISLPAAPLAQRVPFSTSVSLSLSDFSENVPTPPPRWV